MVSIVFTSVILSLAFVGVSRAQKDCSVDHVCFALDQSGSIQSVYPDVQQFTADEATSIDKLTGATYSAVGFSNSFTIISPPTPSLTKFVNAVTAPGTVFGSTNIYAGVSQCYKYVENKVGNRVIVIVTDGEDGGIPRASEIIDQKSSSGVAIVAVGLGSSLDSTYLKDISDIYLPVATTDVTNVGTILSKSICKAPVVSKGPTPTSKPTKTPTPTSGPTSISCAMAYKKCAFKFTNTNSVPTFSVGGKPNSVFTTKIVSKKAPRIGLLNSNGIVAEFIASDGTVTLIDTIGSPLLSPTHFKPFPFYKSRMSGIGHQTFSGNQLKSVKGRCVRVYFTHYQIITTGPKPKVIENINVSKAMNKCVVFNIA